MKFELPKLPYAEDALEPVISKETIQYHYGKHHQTYVTNLNKLVEGTEHDGQNLEEVIKTTSGGMFNNAAQVYNHTFYWNCLSPKKTEASSALKAAIIETFGSIDEFKAQFSNAAVTTFGSGWAWLVKNSHGKLEITTTSNAGCPLTDNKKPLLTFDVWEHAYYVDYRNARPKYVESLWDIVNWEFVSEQFAK
ncbi:MULTISPECIES: superoxide dismutase [Francisella]|uniref:Superoxide dismutase n=1 Tax=Francisella adeliensis TaxID=2007306 RepID=A0A2Z4XWV1_9GAMM|nr:MULTISPECIES: superoxide dismutase [Francisella]AXA33186.1 superoxide dismutase [Fe] [Francisella adeliensis]MBK2085095.1 superoxide dismutase [Francisella adeliensis]MBK2096914.1 superoxide dismutase [Francisella adeliensis]QIW11414.1 superoxide dismutase [Francisella adeliensis]QIW13289.1 superoxide dismutase [Francisella adeliensis]